VFEDRQHSGQTATVPGAATADDGIRIDGLLAACLRAIDETEKVPGFSTWLYLNIAWRLLEWEITFLALFVTPFLDIVRLAARPFVASVPPSPTRFLLRHLGWPFRAIWRGDISGLQVVRLQALTRTFVGSHISGLIEQLKLTTDRERLDILMSQSARAEVLGPLDIRRQKLESLANVAKAQNSLAAVLAAGSASALPLGLAKLLIPAIVQVLPGDVADRIGSFVPLGQALKAIGLAGNDAISLTPMLLTISGAFLTFLLITAMSCHIDKRRILAAAGVYAAENAVRRTRRIGNFELPLDILFAAGAATAGFATMYVYADLMLAEPDRSDQMTASVASLLFCVALAAIAGARRWYLQRPRGSAPMKLLLKMAKGFLLQGLFYRRP
jgi:hypothetical protein